MIGYICKYTPIEIFESMGIKTERIEPEVTSFNQADTLMHPNVCSFAKGVLEEVLQKDYEGIILTTCCDSIRRLYDVLKKKLPDKFIYILDIPRITKDGGIALYEIRVREMIAAYEAFSGTHFEESRLACLLQAASVGKQLHSSAFKTRVGILGARANKNIHKILEDHGIEAVFDITCTGLDRKLLYEKDQPLTGYVRGLLSQFPCMRMETAANRDLLIQNYADNTNGIIYHTVQFCDNFSYEYAWLKEIIHKPMLEEADIANGICRAIANKAYSLMKRVGLEPDFMMTGGVAKNPGVVRAVEEKIQSGLYICPEPEIVGAVGAALYALDTLK